MRGGLRNQSGFSRTSVQRSDSGHPSIAKGARARAGGVEGTELRFWQALLS